MLKVLGGTIEAKKELVLATWLRCNGRRFTASFVFEHKTFLKKQCTYNN